MSSKKETAVEWLIEQLKEYDFADIKDSENYIIKIPAWILTEKQEKAKEMEKQQKIDSYNQGRHNGQVNWGVGNDITAEQYYKETYEQ